MFKFHVCQRFYKDDEAQICHDRNFESCGFILSSLLFIVSSDRAGCVIGRISTKITETSECKSVQCVTWECIHDGSDILKAIRESKWERTIL